MEAGKANIDIAELRRRYTKGGLTEEMLPTDPLQLLREWVEQAVVTGVAEPNAMALATVRKEGIPDVRIVLMKGIEEESVLFYTNYTSQKAADLQAHPHAGCSIWWPELERQIRIRGSVEKVSREQSADYFARRPRESQIGAWASSQSQVVEGREELQRRFRELERRFEGKPVPLPDHWGGFRILVSEIEFWQGRPGRMHDRIRYRKSSEGWTRERLMP